MDVAIRVSLAVVAAGLAAGDAAALVQVDSLEIPVIAGAVEVARVPGGLVRPRSPEGLRLGPRRPDPVYLAEFAFTDGTTAIWELELRITDASNPAAPVERARIAFDRFETIGRVGRPVFLPQPSGLRVGGPVAYAAAFGGVRAIDVSDPARPVALRTFPAGPPLDLQSGVLLGAGITATDVSIPGAPRVLGSFRPAGQMWDAAISRGLVFVAGSAGLRVVDLGPEYGLALPASIELLEGAPAAGRGLLRVALLGAPELDASQVDLATLRLHPGGAAPLAHPRARVRDRNGDGLADLLLAFRAKRREPPREDELVCLSGETLDRSFFEACAPVGAPSRRETGE